MSACELFRLYTMEEAASGREGYPPEWDSIGGGVGLKHIVRARAGDRCLRCGHPYESKMGEWSPCDDACRHGDPTRFVDALGQELPPAPPGATYDFSNLTREARWRILTVHHLTEEKRDCRWWNLVALCQRDHLLIQRKVRMDRPWPWEHSEWFKPYAAGWYAWRFLGLELDRVEVEPRMDELLTLGARESAVERMPL